MKNNMIHIIVWMILVVSGVFFTLTFVEYREQENVSLMVEQLENGLLLTFPFQFEELHSSLSPIYNSEPVKNDRVLQDDFTALILLSPTVCTSCILETHEWLNLLNDLKEDAVRPVLIIIENDSSTAHSFYQKNQFSEISFWGRNSLIDEITEISLDLPPVGQLIAFVNNRENKIIRRYIIPNQVSSQNSKLMLLEQVLLHLNDEPY